MKRLQGQNSVYNVYDWENERKQQVKRVKNICYHPPSLLKKKRRSRRGPGFESVKNEPNRQLFDLYQQSLRMSMDPLSDDLLMQAENTYDSDAKRLMSDGPGQLPSAG